MQIKEGRLLEIQNLYYGAYLNFDQIDKINKLLYVLAKHMFVDKETLNKLSDTEIPVSYLKKASKHNMITIIKDIMNEERIYYYQLGIGGYSLLNAAGKNYNMLNVMANLKDRLKILAMNRFIIENGLSLLYNSFQGDQCDYFFCKDGDKNDVIVYHDMDKDYNTIVRELLGILVKEYVNKLPVHYTKKGLEEKYRFVRIKEKLSIINRKAKRDDNKEE